jgi:hypothetical protein
LRRAVDARRDRAVDRAGRTARRRARRCARRDARRTRARFPEDRKRARPGGRNARLRGRLAVRCRPGGAASARHRTRDDRRRPASARRSASVGLARSARIRLAGRAAAHCARPAPGRGATTRCTSRRAAALASRRCAVGARSVASPRARRPRRRDGPDVRHSDPALRAAGRPGTGCRGGTWIGSLTTSARNSRASVLRPRSGGSPRHGLQRSASGSHRTRGLRDRAGRHVARAHELLDVGVRARAPRLGDSRATWRARSAEAPLRARPLPESETASSLEEASRDMPRPTAADRDLRRVDRGNRRRKAPEIGRAGRCRSLSRARSDPAF